MPCNKCGQLDPCNTCEENESCDCIQKDMSTDCSVFTGDDLECSGIKKDTVLTTVIQSLDTHICNKFEEAIQYLTLSNIGEGAKVFEGINGIGNKQLRSILSGDLNLIDIIQNDETIDIIPGTPSLNLTSDILSIIFTTISGPTTFGSVDLYQYSVDTFIQSLIFDNSTQILTIALNNGQPDLTVDLSSSDNHLESVVYNIETGNIEFTLVDDTVFTLDMGSILNEVQIQSDYLENNTTSPSYIVNRNPSKTVVLGALGNYNVSNSDNNYIIEIDNGTNDVTIDFSNITAITEFFVGFVQKGTGLVTFNNADIVPQNFTNVLFGQGHSTAVEIISNTKYLLGNLKPV